MSSGSVGQLGGKHRGYVFRQQVGDAIIASAKQYTRITLAWGVGSNVSREVKNAEQPVKLAVNEYMAVFQPSV
ncbi:MAG: hypothetical protein HKL84_08130 [Acidimicrobiaceae bacterium]|nr:hypothetical protein [Acidimicrobiaceae bacterium]